MTLWPNIWKISMGKVHSLSPHLLALESQTSKIASLHKSFWDSISVRVRYTNTRTHTHTIVRVRRPLFITDALVAFVQIIGNCEPAEEFMTGSWWCIFFYLNFNLFRVNSSMTGKFYYAEGLPPVVHWRTLRCWLSEIFERRDYCVGPGHYCWTSVD